MTHQDIIQEFMLNCGDLVFLIQMKDKAGGCIPVKINLPHQAKLIAAIGSHGSDPAAPVGSIGIVIGISIAHLGRIVGRIHVALKNIFIEVEIGVYHIGIFKAVLNPDYRRGIVFNKIFLVDHNMDVEFVFQIEKPVRHISHNYGDVRNTGLPELPYLPFDHDLSFDNQKALRLVVGKGCQPGRHSRSQDDGVIDLEAVKDGKPRLGQGVILQVPLFSELPDMAVDAAQGYATGLRNVPLGAAGLVLKVKKDVKLVFCYHDGTSNVQYLTILYKF
jgi:hypothetical protein